MSDFCKHDVHLTIDCSACRKNICEKREDYNHIQSLKAQIEILEKAVDFYANKENWYYYEIDDSDGYLETGGKLARQTKEKLNALRKEKAK